MEGDGRCLSRPFKAMKFPLALYNDSESFSYLHYRLGIQGQLPMLFSIAANSLSGHLPSPGSKAPMHVISSPFSPLTAMREWPGERCEQRQPYHQSQASLPLMEKQGWVSKKLYDDILKTASLIIPNNMRINLRTCMSKGACAAKEILSIHRVSETFGPALLIR